MTTHVAQLRRTGTSQPWGFKMQGGTDVGLPLFVAHVAPNSIAAHAGLKPGDGILNIGACVADCFSHEQARGEMIRSGNEIDLTVKRGVVYVPPPEVGADEEPARMSVSADAEGPYQDVQPKTYKELEKEEATGARPASIFDKKKQKRSDYTKTSQSGYQKAFGQTK